MWSTAPDRYRGVPRAQARRIRERDDHTCQKCGMYGMDVDHIINVAEGGTDDDDNLQVLCPICHEVKTRTEAIRGKRRQQYFPEGIHPGLRR